jgi:ParB family chromosome partitioning protein
VFYSANDKVQSIGLDLQITRTLRNVRSAMTPPHGKVRTPIQQFLFDQHQQWRERLPKANGDELWGWLVKQDEATLLSLLAFCLGMIVSPTNTRMLKAIGEVCSLDLTQWWTPTAGNYLNRVTREQILEAVREGAGDEAERQVAKLKKRSDMANRAEELLRGKGWLPKLFKE